MAGNGSNSGNNYQRPSLAVVPSHIDSLEGAVDFAIERRFINHPQSMPAKVVAFDREKNTVDVQPLLKIQGTDGQTLDRPIIKGISVSRLGGGGAIMSLPLQKGDIGYLMAADRDPATVRAHNYQRTAAPPTGRMHSFSNGRFVPDQAPQWSAKDNNVPAGDVYFGSTGGKARFTFNNGAVLVKCDSGTVTIATEAGSIVMQGKTITINGDVHIVGKLDVDNDSTANKGKVSLMNHTHPAPGGETGKPSGQ